jgi:erythromycin esterase-like protein
MDAIRSRLRPLAVLTVCLALSALLPPPASAAEEAARAPRTVGYPVLPGIWRLHGNDPNLPQDDLEALRAVIGKAQVVGLGETVHTSGGYYRMKHRVFRFLVEKMGFRVFAFESPWTGADQVARYVQTCDGDPVEAIRGLFGVWQSTEVADLVEWMCEWNRAHPKPKDKVHFFGFDIQQPDDDGPALMAFLHRTGVPEDHAWMDAIEACDGVVSFSSVIPRESHEKCLGGLAEVEAHLRADAQSLIRQTSKQDLELAKLFLVGLRAWENMNFEKDPARSFTYRDESMAYAFQALRAMRFPRAKIAVWAHNSHISRAVHPSNGGRVMGMYLAESLKGNYVNLSLASYRTAIDWLSLGCGPIDVQLDGSVEAPLHDLGHAALLVDLDFRGTSEPYLPPGEYFLGSRRMDPRAHYDGILYLEDSPKMTPTGWRPSC